jgi:predicted SpoU family rRNA methylase
MSSKITITQIKSKYDVPFFTATQETRNMVREFKDRGDLIHVTDVYDSEILTRVRTLIFKDRASLDAFRIANIGHRTAMEAHNATVGIAETILIEDVV